MHKLEDETKAGCPLGNKAMQTKLTGVWGGKEREKRKSRYAQLNRGREKRLIHIED